MKRTISIITPYPLDTAPSQRFRFEQFSDLLQRKQIAYTVLPFLSKKGYEQIYNSIFNGIWFSFSAMVRRCYHIVKTIPSDSVFIHREASPIGPPIFEWFIAKVLRKKIIYDFDDAIWLNDPSENGSIKAILKCKWKVANICRWSYKISVGNEYLANYARQFNDNVIINPTTVDAMNYHNPDLYQNMSPHKKLTIGWTGSHSTLHYLQQVIPVLKQLELSYAFRLLVIANKPPAIHLNSMEFIKWSKQTEIEDLMQIDIGIMPLTEDSWSQGKCGFKAIQYLALGKPAIATPVGVNSQIVLHGENGFLCNTTDEWKEALVHLITNETLRKKMGVEGRLFIQENYSKASNAKVFLSLFD